MTDFMYDVELALEVLLKGGLILYPTDTIWGIGCDATHAGAVERIGRLKQMNGSTGMIALLAEEQELIRHVAAPDLALFDYLYKQPRPTTVIYDGAIGFAENLVSADGSMAIRLVQDAFCRHLVRRLRRPLVSTAASIAMQAYPRNFNEVEESIRLGVDYIVQYRQDDITPFRPSTIIRYSKGEVVVVRGAG